MAGARLPRTSTTRPRLQPYPARCPFGSPLLGSRGQDIPRLHLERLGQFPNGANGDRSARFDALVVPEAEAKIHHVFLSETAGLAERADVSPECLAESWEVQGHRAATLGARDHSDHGPKCRKRLRGCGDAPTERPWAVCWQNCVSCSCASLWDFSAVAAVGVKPPAPRTLPPSRAAAAALPERLGVWAESQEVAELASSQPRPPAPRQPSVFPVPAYPARALPASRVPRFARPRGRLRRACA